MPPRIGTSDLLKGSAVLLMVQVHLAELFAQPAILDTAIGKGSLFLGGPPAAPVFMAVMGYLLAVQPRATGHLLQRGLRLILLGFLLNIGLNLRLLVRICNHTLNVNPWEYVLGVDILFLAGVSLMVIVLLQRWLGNRFWIYLILAIGAAAISPIFSRAMIREGWTRYVFAFLGGDYRWSYFPVFPWLAYPLLGYSFGRFAAKPVPMLMDHQGRIAIAVLSAVVLIATVRFGWTIASVLPRYYHHDVRFFLWGMVFLIFWGSLFSLLEEDFGGHASLCYLKWVGKNVTAFYVLQWLIIGNIATSLFKSQHLAELILWYPSVLLVVSVLVYLLNACRHAGAVDLSPKDTIP